MMRSSEVFKDASIMRNICGPNSASNWGRKGLAANASRYAFLSGIMAAFCSLSHFTSPS